MELGNCMNRIDIYIEMLRAALPYIRNVQSHGVLTKGFDKPCYYESELLHNIVGSLNRDDICEWDIHFLNNQAKYYIDSANDKICPNYCLHKKHIKMIFELIPEHLKEKLQWTMVDSY